MGYHKHCLRLPKSFQKSQEGIDAGFTWKCNSPRVRDGKHVEGFVRKTRAKVLNEGMSTNEYGDETAFDWVLCYDTNVQEGFTDIMP